MKHFRKQNPLIRLWLIIGIVAGFSTVLFFSISHIKNVVLCDATCAVQNDVAIAVVLAALMGVFVGSLTYYFIAEKYEKKIDRIHHDSTAALKFLDPESRAVLNTLIQQDGEISQSGLVTETGFSRVKVSRLLNSLEQKGIVAKRKSGMTNRIVLSEDMRKIFLPDNENTL
ncbi:MAG: MarR family transcriptional regulator [Candidatus Woesearchaeota archaeon]